MNLRDELQKRTSFVYDDHLEISTEVVCLSDVLELLDKWEKHAIERSKEVAKEFYEKGRQSKNINHISNETSDSNHL